MTGKYKCTSLALIQACLVNAKACFDIKWSFLNTMPSIQVVIFPLPVFQYLLLSQLCHLKYYGQVEWPLALDCKHSALIRVGSGVTFPAFENTIEKCHHEDPANGGQSKQMKEQRCERTSHFHVPCFESGPLLQERLYKIAKMQSQSHTTFVF